MVAARRLTEAGLCLSRDGDAVTVTLDRPERRNAQTPAMWSALADIGRELPGDVRFVILRGAGASFSSGLDVAAFGSGIDGEITLAGIAALPSAAAQEVIASFQRAFTWWSRPDIITIAVVQGHAIGAGAQLALACDLRIAADDMQLSLPEASLGLVPDLGGTAALVRAVGFSRALEICLTGRHIGAAEAHRLGLVTIVVAPTDLDAALADCVSAMRATKRETATEIKALLSLALDQTVERQLASEREAQVRRLKDAAQIGD